MHVSGLPPSKLWRKTKYFINLFFKIKIWWGMTWDMHKRAFQDLKLTFMHVSGLPHHIQTEKKLFSNLFCCLSKYGGGRPEKCINVRFRAWNPLLCMLQVFPLPYFNKRQNKLENGFFPFEYGGEDLRHA